MTEFIDADELVLMAANFEDVLAKKIDPGDAERTLYDLGWPDLLSASPAQVAAVAFEALGATGSAAALLDDVVIHALGLPVSLDLCVLIPAVLHTNPADDETAAMGQDDHLVINGLVSSRLERATTLVMAIEGFFGPELITIDAGLLRDAVASGIDPAHAYRHLSAKVEASDVIPLESKHGWEDATTAARAALAHQLISGARWMLAEARQHAVDRMQFGRPVASFQAIRHKLAESFVLIEGAASVAEASTYSFDYILALLAKSLAGQAALTTATHAQQVLAGMGFTAEHDFHLCFKRVLVLDALFGSSSMLPTEIGRTLLEYGSVPRPIQL